MSTYSDIMVLYDKAVIPAVSKYSHFISVRLHMFYILQLLIRKFQLKTWTHRFKHKYYNNEVHRKTAANASNTKQLSSRQYYPRPSFFGTSLTTDSGWHMACYIAGCGANPSKKTCGLNFDMLKSRVCPWQRKSRTFIIGLTSAGRKKTRWLIY